MFTQKIGRAVSVLAAVAVCGIAGSVNAAVTTTRTEADLAAPKSANNTLGTDEYGTGNSQSYTGGGAGFGGYVGGSTTYFAASATHLHIGWQPGGSVGGNQFAIMFNVNGSGTTSTAFKNDGSDGSRRASTFSIDNGGVGPFGGAVNYSVPVTYALVFSEFGAGLFAPNNVEANFITFDGAAGGNGNAFRETSIPWSSLGGLASFIDFFAYGTSGSGYVSNEAYPNSPTWTGAVDGGGNPGFGGGDNTLTFTNNHRFVIPTPGSAALLGLAGVLGLRRRRQA